MPSGWPLALTRTHALRAKRRAVPSGRRTSLVVSVMTALWTWEGLVRWQVLWWQHGRAGNGAGCRVAAGGRRPDGGRALHPVPAGMPVPHLSPGRPNPRLTPTRRAWPAATLARGWARLMATVMMSPTLQERPDWLMHWATRAPELSATWGRVGGGDVGGGGVARGGRRRPQAHRPRGAPAAGCRWRSCGRGRAGAWVWGVVGCRAATHHRAPPTSSSRPAKMKAAAVLALLAACIAGAAAMGDPTEPLAGVLDLGAWMADRRAAGAMRGWAQGAGSCRGGGYGMNAGPGRSTTSFCVPPCSLPHQRWPLRSPSMPARTMADRRATAGAPADERASDLSDLWPAGPQPIVAPHRGRPTRVAPRAAGDHAPTSPPAASLPSLPAARPRHVRQARQRRQGRPDRVLCGEGGR